MGLNSFWKDKCDLYFLRRLSYCIILYSGYSKLERLLKEKIFKMEIQRE